jgi:succinate dehydrogenase / fumarate reductase flavoprotein subunit
MSELSYHEVLVVGGGLAGLRAAVAAHESGSDVAVLSKVYPIRSHSGAAQGGVNAALGNHPEGHDDTWQRHAFDTIKGADYLADQPRAEILAREAPERVLEMEHWGTYFSRFPDGRIAQRPFGGAGFPRTCYAADRTGHQMLHTLYQQCLKRDIPFHNEWLLTRLAVHGDGGYPRDESHPHGRVVGAIALHVPSGELRAFRADAVIVAGGGHGRIYAKSTNSYINVGSATAAVYRAGVPLEDMAFVQFHPTTLYGTNILITEGVRGEGGHLLNNEGERFMERYAPDTMELAPRDIVARAIQTEVDEGRGFADGYVQLDVRHLGEEIIKQRLPGIRQIAMDFAGVDPIETPIPVQPGQHYSMGGLACDENGATSVGGLFVVGECSCISVHGANRLGGNSLLETIVFGKRAGDLASGLESPGARIADRVVREALRRQEDEIEALKGRAEGERQIAIRREMQETMTEHVGVFRDGAGLSKAVEKLAHLKERYRHVVLDHSGRGFNYDLVDTLELEGMLDLAEATALTALQRTECRGSHWRTDHLGRDDERWLRHSLASYNAGGRPQLSYKDVIITTYPPQEREY